LAIPVSRCKQPGQLQIGAIPAARSAIEERTAEMLVKCAGVDLTAKLNRRTFSLAGSADAESLERFSHRGAQ
jgi:hypothetical protein